MSVLPAECGQGDRLMHKQLKSEKVDIKVFDTDHSFSNVKDDLIKVIVDWTKD